MKQVLLATILVENILVAAHTIAIVPENNVVSQTTARKDADVLM
jgi:hypothetical protein